MGTLGSLAQAVEVVFDGTLVFGDRLGWHYVLRLPANTWVGLPEGWTGRINQLAGPQGRRHYYPQVTLTKKATRTCALSVGLDHKAPLGKNRPKGAFFY